MPIRLIYNPKAGNGKATRILQQIAPYLSKYHVEVTATQYPGQATELAREVAHDPAMTVVSLGGDGTHHEVVNGILPLGQAAFAVIPAGTGNDFVRILDYPPSLPQQVEAAFLGGIRHIDVGMVGDRYFLTVAGIGFDAEVAGWVNRQRHKSGSLIFIKGVLLNVLRFRSQILQVVWDQGQLSAATFLVAAGNTPYYGRGLQICPEANPCDGTLAITWIDRVAPLSVLPLLARVMHGTHISRPQVRSFQTQQLEVSGPPQLWVHADGELLGHLPVTIRVVPKALAVRWGTLATPEVHHE